MELKPVYTVKNLSFAYPKHSVLDGVDLALYPGEVVSLLGPNGCGKSTLIRLMLRLLEGKGDIRLHGQPLYNYNHRDIATHVAYIPQYHNVPFGYSVEEMVLMGRVSKLGFFAHPSRRDRDIARAALERVGIADLASRPFGQLSGGQKQMVLLARAIAQEVRTFIMDEPVNGLDYGNQMRLLRMITELAAEGYTFLKTTHYPDHALLVSTRVIVMHGGKIIANGDPDAVITPRMLRHVYDVDAEVIRHRERGWCVPHFTSPSHTPCS
ncbi:ABC transporter ATP-binding protein [Sulfurimonas sp. HSL-3221]|uniref:ABC transporter ATP-binding protein n=1 Tax=Sulfurimonadaceae TaxID=2771471 RepID=UPI001E4E98E0|nr:ABC transporter ATP-binding protein [Sulfurimonas sp. HSL-3221]UFS62594.1 ABC transporter ATP-binding protein [Sulfurimonas sp. HSL-3221]